MVLFRFRNKIEIVIRYRGICAKVRTTFIQVVRCICAASGCGSPGRDDPKKGNLMRLLRHLLLTLALVGILVLSLCYRFPDSIHILSNNQ